MGNSGVHLVKGKERVVQLAQSCIKQKSMVMGLVRCPERTRPLDEALREPTLSSQGSACGQWERSKLPARVYHQLDRYAFSANIPKGRELRASWKFPRKDSYAAPGWHPRKPGEGLNSGQRSRVCDT